MKRRQFVTASLPVLAGTVVAGGLTGEILDAAPASEVSDLCNTYWSHTKGVESIAAKLRAGVIDSGDADDLIGAALDQRDLVFEWIKGTEPTTPMDAADVLDVTLHEGRDWIDDEHRELIGRVSKSLRALV